jgi:hypothetical protein
MLSPINRMLCTAALLLGKQRLHANIVAGKSDRCWWFIAEDNRDAADRVETDIAVCRT